ncbi:MAG: FAD-dependent oxidoreductase [Betaproteobacteria bacterium]|nr:FAD-dependent oxidoreductase [Betaproteobacteria bacterium]
MQKHRIVVVGAGIVGVSCAMYLVRDGHDVTLLDALGPAEGASKGNAGALSPGSCVPLAMPGVLQKVPKWLTDPAGPLTIRPAYFLAALPWLVRFVLAARQSRIEPIADALRALHAGTYECYEPMLERAGCRDAIRRTGNLVVYESESAFAASRAEWDMRSRRGVRFEVLDASALRATVPALSERYVRGVLSPEHGFVVEPFHLVRALADQVVRDGGRLVRAKAEGLRLGAAGVTAVRTDNGEIAADRVVIAAGAWSLPLLAPLGLKLPLETQRGYHVTIATPGVEPHLPVTSSERKFYATPMTGGLRIAGTVEFAGLDAAPDYRRARRLLEQGRGMYPALDTGSYTEWMGHRPCFPDSLPVIGPVPRHPEVLLAFGHGHNGMTSGPVSGRLIADLVAGRPPFLDLGPYLPERFV